MSPSRAKDFLQCPLMFRLRTVDHLPEPGSLATHKGTLVHAVLERLYDLPAPERRPEAALGMLPAQWQAHRERNPVVMDLFESPEQVEPWLEEARALLRSYFTMENPTRLEPAERELFVEVETEGGLLLRGFVDRLDVAPDGAMRVVDYKTGRSPAPRFQEEALFQMRFYALVLLRLRGQAPRRLQLLYLRDGRTLTHDPRPGELDSAQTRLERIWDEVEDCASRGEFAPQRSRLCDWCAFQSSCPLFGGTTPPLPEEGVAQLLTARRPAA
ncbi:PD-(D/E)XK nuclease family protein [Actinomyces sp. 186855]|nr:MULTISPECIES: PD-(D/E)XK nuclease family protein [unclassified Actinomyces]MCL3777525.1 PD-(D/E)XK nuclease family protein [Actinomyces sp. AC-20-1]MCL3790333.1 PD-(D/E)XK nuclease family protein [Actinomyces sp. 187325]MCL3792614.1 PD-(D/E)XK nuclease family protein [Actinomyces sp. 186855]MCL3795109.1 PD-(D/E)XK nuclease family protein [Actinomyces sp. 217892]